MSFKRLLGLLFSLSALASGSAVVLAAPAAHAIIPCDESCGGGGGGGGGGSGGGGGGVGVDPLPGPRYVVEAVWFQCLDETGETSVGSDETRFTFDSTDAEGTHVHTSQFFDDVDTTEHRYFDSSPRVLSPSGGSPAPITLATLVMEEDTWPDSDDTIGHSTITFSPAELEQADPYVGMSTVRTLTFTGDFSNYELYLTVTRVA
jgi:hypothetical protein